MLQQIQFTQLHLNCIFIYRQSYRSINFPIMLQICISWSISVYVSLQHCTIDGLALGSISHWNLLNWNLHHILLPRGHWHALTYPIPLGRDVSDPNEDVPENEKAPSHRVYKRRFRFRDFFFWASFGKTTRNDPDRPGPGPNPTRRRLRKKTDVSENEKGRNRLATNLSFYRSYVFFARTPGNPLVRWDVGTSPKKSTTDLKTKVVRLEKLVIKSVDPVDGGRSVSAHGPNGPTDPTHPTQNGRLRKNSRRTSKRELFVSKSW